MKISWTSWRNFLTAAAIALATVAGLGMARATAKAADIDPTMITAKLPDQINWTGNPNVAQTAVLLGDPSKPGLYIILIKWMPHQMSHPHFHPNDRYITVLSGTWWVGTGTKYDPDATVPMPAGSYVIDIAKQPHFDGAKDVPAELEIVGQGPATMTPDEVK